MDRGDGLLVRKIREGVVVDHIPPGRAFTVLRVLGLLPPKPYSGRIAIVINAESGKMGRKDIVKIEGYGVEDLSLEALGIVAPGATVNVVREYKVVEKRRLDLPEEASGVLRCPNPTCITRKEREKATPRMRLVSRSPAKYRCVYCGSTISEEEFQDLIAI